MMISILAVVLSLTLSKVAAEAESGFVCSLCMARNNSTPDVSALMLFPERIVPDSAWTCKEIDESILSDLSLDDCEAGIASLPNEASIDLAAFCGCEGTTNTSGDGNVNHQCSFCSGSATTTSSVAPSSYLARLPPSAKASTATAPSSSPAPTTSMIRALSTSVLGWTQALASSEPTLHNEEIIVVDTRQGPQDMGTATSFDNFCIDLSTIAPFVKDPDYCDTMIRPMEKICCPNKGVDTCSLCPAGSVMKHPNREIPFWNGDFSAGGGTCQELEAELASISVNSCEQAKFGCGSGTLDLPAFCGCNGVELSNSCSFCNPEDMLNPDYNLSELVNYGLTCKHAAELAQFILADSMICHDRFNLLRKGCCRDEGRCHMCSDGTDEIAFPEKIMALNHDPQNCADFQFGLGFMDQDQCNEIRSNFPVDFASYCGCPGATSASECSLCGGRFEVLRDQAKDGGSEGGISCGDIEDLVRHITDPDLCVNFQASTRPRCCAAEDVVVPSKSENVSDLEEVISSEIPLKDPSSSSKVNNGVVISSHLFTIFVIRTILIIMNDSLE